MEILLNFINKIEMKYFYHQDGGVDEVMKLNKEVMARLL